MKAQEINLDIPEWWLPDCPETRLLAKPVEGFLESIKCGAAGLNIKRHEMSDIPKELNIWQVWWYYENRDGTLIFHAKAMAGAFCGADYIEPSSHYLIKKYGGQATSRRKFIRQDNFLTILGVSAGYAEGPNVSIQLNEETMARFKKMLKM